MSTTNCLLDGEAYDGEVELHENGRAVGRLFKFQLKSRSSISWKNSSRANSSPLAVATAHYWLELQKQQNVPVFLFEVDLTEQSVYFEPLGPQLRKKYDVLLTKKTVTVELQRERHLAAPDAAALFERLFLRECGIQEFMNAAENFLLSLSETARFLLLSQGRDGHMEVDDLHRASRIRMIYQDLVSLQIHLRLQTDDLAATSLPNFDALVSRCQTEMRASGEMLEYTMTVLCETLEKVLPGMASSIIIHFYQREAAYWRHQRPRLFETCERSIEFVNSYMQELHLPRRIRLERYSASRISAVGRI